MMRIDRTTRRYIDERLRRLMPAASMISTDADHQFVTAQQIADWTEGSKIRPVVLRPENLMGITYQYHGLGTTDVWVEVKNSLGVPDFNVIAAPDLSYAQAGDYIKVTVPSGEQFTGEIRIEKINP